LQTDGSFAPLPHCNFDRFARELAPACVERQRKPLLRRGFVPRLIYVKAAMPKVSEKMAAIFDSAGKAA